MKKHSLRKKAFLAKKAEEKQAETQLVKEHVTENHTIEQVDGSSELHKSPKKVEHDELWCYKCEEQQDYCQCWEHQLPNKPAMKAHMHTKHTITIFEDIVSVLGQD